MSGNRPRSGILAILGIAVFGAAILLLLYRAPRFADRSPDVPFGIPKRAMRFVAIDVRSAPGGIDAAIAQLSQVRPDFALIQGVEVRDAARVARALGASDARSSSFYPAQNLNGSNSSWGNLVASRHPLYEGRSIPNRGGSFGVWAVAVADGVKFYVGSANFAEPDAPQTEVETLARAYAKLGSPPIVLGVRAVGLDGADVSVLSSAGLIATSASLGTESIFTGGEWRIADVQSSIGGSVVMTTAGAP